MGQLVENARIKLISSYVDRAKINVAHMAIAQMVKKGLITRVLTTNFDPLVSRACAFINVFPAVYDMAVVTRGYSIGRITDPAIIHLHGQRHGFVQLHKDEDVSRLSDGLGPLIHDSAKVCTWLVVGYSGNNDPVFRKICELPSFDGRMFWIGYQETPDDMIQRELLNKGKDAHWYGGQDADIFLSSLASELKCFPPQLISRPFSLVHELLDELSGFRLPGQDTEIDYLRDAKIRVQRACELFEDASTPMTTSSAKRGSTLHPSQASRTAIVASAWINLMSGNYDKTIAYQKHIDEPQGDALREPVAWALVGKGNAHRDEAKNARDKKRRGLLVEAEKCYEKATLIDPEHADAVQNWGLALRERADLEKGNDREHLLQQADQKREDYLRIKKGGIKRDTQAQSDVLRSAPNAPDSNVVPFPTGNVDALNGYRFSIIGRAAAESDSRQYSAFIYQQLGEESEINLSGYSAYLVTEGSLQPVIRAGDAVITDHAGIIYNNDLVIAAVEGKLYVRRYQEAASLPNMIVLTAQSDNPINTKPPLVTRYSSVNARKIVGVVFGIGCDLDSNPIGEAAQLIGQQAIRTKLNNVSGVVEVRGESAEPIILDGQFILLGKPLTFASDIHLLIGEVVVAIDNTGASYIKRLGAIRDGVMVLESVEVRGGSGPILLTMNEGRFPQITSISPVIGVLFERIQQA